MPWMYAANLSDFADKDVIGVKIGDQEIALYHLDGEYFATHDVCTHQRALLSDGYVENGCIECPVHQALFEIRTGKAIGGVAKHDLRTFEIRVSGDVLEVMLD